MNELNPHDLKTIAGGKGCICIEDEIERLKDKVAETKKFIKDKFNAEIDRAVKKSLARIERQQCPEVTPEPEIIHSRTGDNI